MLSHPGGWAKPIPAAIHICHHRTSTPNNLEKPRQVCVLNIFCTFLDKNEKNNQSLHWGRDSGMRSSCPRFATFTTRQDSSWIANLGHSDEIPWSFLQCGVRFYKSLLKYKKQTSAKMDSPFLSLHEHWCTNWDDSHIFSIEHLSKTGYLQGYVMVDFICMGLLELQRALSENW